METRDLCTVLVMIMDEVLVTSRVGRHAHVAVHDQAADRNITPELWLHSALLDQ